MLTMKSTKLVSVLVFSAGLLSACAASALQMTMKQVTPTDSEVIMAEAQTQADMRLQDGAPADSDSGISIDFNQVIAIGEKVFQIVKDGQAVLNFQPQKLSVVPAGISSWTQLEKWNSTPVLNAYELSFTNLLGIEVVSIRYLVVAHYGGSYQGRGRYLANVTVLPSDISVLWGYTVDVTVEAQDPLNAGTTLSPLAVLPVQVKAEISTLIKTEVLTQGYNLRGDGFVATY